MKSLGTLCEAEMWDHALDELDDLRRAGKWDPRLEATQTSIYCRMGEYARVIELTEGRDDERNTAAVAVALAHLGRHDEALEMARTGVGKRREHAEAAMAGVLERTGDLDGALLWCERAAERFGERGFAMRRVARLLTEMQDHKEACAAWEQSLRLSPFVRAEDLEQLAACRRQLGEPARASEAEALAAEYRARDGAKAAEIALLTERMRGTGETDIRIRKAPGHPWKNAKRERGRSFRT